MPQCVFVGYRYVDYVSKTNKPVKGYSVYFNETRPGTVGSMAYDAWISCEVFENFFSTLNIGDNVNLLYDRFGHVIGATLI